MKSRIISIIIALATAAVVTVAASQPALAAFGSISRGATTAKTDEQPVNLLGDGGIFERVTTILMFAVGALSVIMLIIGGIRYVVSGGRQEAITGAKNTILYAVVGIVVALLAYAAIHFVVDMFADGGSGGGIDI